MHDSQAQTQTVSCPSARIATVYVSNPLYTGLESADPCFACVLALRGATETGDTVQRLTKQSIGLVRCTETIRATNASIRDFLFAKAQWLSICTVIVLLMICKSNINKLCFYCNIPGMHSTDGFLHTILLAYICQVYIHSAISFCHLRLAAAHETGVQAGGADSMLVSHPGKETLETKAVAAVGRSTIPIRRDPC